MAPRDKEAETIHLGMKGLGREASASRDRMGNMSAYSKHLEPYMGNGKEVMMMMAESSVESGTPGFIVVPF